MTVKDRTGDELETSEAGPDLARHALEIARRTTRLCPACGGPLQPGWHIHPGCEPAHTTTTRKA